MPNLQEMNQVKLQSVHAVFQMFEAPFKQLGKITKFVSARRKQLSWNRNGRKKGLIIAQHSRKSCYFNVPFSWAFCSLMRSVTLVDPASCSGLGNKILSAYA